MAVWPFLWAATVTLAILARVTGNRRDALALLVVFLAFLAVWAKNQIFPDDFAVRTAIGALIWTGAATTLFRAKYPLASSLLVLVVLCSAYAQVYQIEPGFLVFPFWLADVLVMLAVFWIGRAGLIQSIDFIGNLALRRGRYRSSAAVSDVEVSEETPE